MVRDLIAVRRSFGATPFAALVVVFLLASTAEATTGGDSKSYGFCLERSGRRVLHFFSQGGESGCYDELRAIDVSTGRTTAVLGCDSEQAPARRQLLDGCAPLTPMRLDSLGLTAKLSPGGPSLDDPPVDPFLFRPVCPQSLTLTRGGQAVASRSIPACCFSSQPPVAQLTAHVARGRPFALVTARAPSICFESGYLGDQLLFLPSLFGASGPAKIKSGENASTWVTFDRRGHDPGSIYRTAAKRLRAKGLPEAAEHYLQGADAADRATDPRGLPELCTSTATSWARLGNPYSGHWLNRGCESRPGYVNLQDLTAQDSCAGAPPTQPDGGFDQCQALRGAPLSSLGLAVALKSVGPPKLPPPPDSPDDYAPTCPHELTVTAGAKVVAKIPLNADCVRTGQPLVSVSAHPLPGSRRALLRVTLPGTLYPRVLLIPTAKEAKAKLPPRAPEVWRVLDLPVLDSAQLFNDVGMELYRAGKLEPAAAYFGEAFRRSLPPRTPLLLAQFNHAATLAKAGKEGEALNALRILFSFRAEQARFVAKVAQDPDFAALRETAAYRGLESEPDCCVITREHGPAQLGQDRFQRSVSRYREGEEELLENRMWTADGGVLFHHRYDPSDAG